MVNSAPTTPVRHSQIGSDLDHLDAIIQELKASVIDLRNTADPFLSREVPTNDEVAKEAGLVGGHRSYVSDRLNIFYDDIQQIRIAIDAITNRIDI